MINQFVIYHGASNHPRGSWVVREWRIENGQLVAMPDAIVCRTLRQARGKIPPGKHRMERHKLDDPVIHETWI